MTEQEKIQLLESLLSGDFDEIVSDMDASIYAEQANQLIQSLLTIRVNGDDGQPEEYKMFRNYLTKYNKFIRKHLEYSSDHRSKCNQCIQDKNGLKIQLYAYPLYIDENCKTVFNDSFKFVPDSIESCGILINDIENIDGIFKEVISPAIQIYDVTSIKNMNFVCGGTSTLSCSVKNYMSIHTDSMRLKLENVNLNILDNSKLDQRNGCIFVCDVIPTFVNVSGNIDKIGIYGDNLFTNKRNQKLFDIFEWGGKWDILDKSYTVKSFRDIYKILIDSKSAFKKRYNATSPQERYKYSAYHPYDSSDSMLPIKSDASVSDFLDISKFPELNVIKLTDGELMLTFYKAVNNLITIHGAKLGTTRDGYIVTAQTDSTNNSTSFETKYW